MVSGHSDGANTVVDSDSGGQPDQQAGVVRLRATQDLLRQAAHWKGKTRQERAGQLHIHTEARAARPAASASTTQASLRQ